MHSDTYDYNDNLWKGNVFSKLLKENYINSFVVLGGTKRKNCLYKKRYIKRYKEKNKYFVQLWYKKKFKKI